MTRNGKIARLPRAVRDQLNQRLDEGEQGKQLVAWLNGLPEVQERLKSDFQGKAINEQNMTEWKQGGFQDWLRHQEAVECVRTAAEEAQELAYEARAMPLSEMSAAPVALLLAKLIREAGSGVESTPEGRQEMLALIREWTAVRKGDHKAVLLKMRMKDWATVRATAAAEEEKAAAEAAEAAAQEAATAGDRKIAEFQKQHDRVENDVISEVSKAMGRNALINQLVSHLPPPGAKKLKDLIESEIKERQEKLIEEQKREWRALAGSEEQPEEEHEDSDLDQTCAEAA